jgi:hypothetical protein
MLEQKFARFISYAFHPIFIPTLGVLIIINSSTFSIPLNIQMMIFGLMVSSTVVFPLLILFIYNRSNFIAAMQMTEKNERHLPYLIMLVTYIIIYLLFLQVSLPEVFHRYLFGNIIICLAAVLINLRYKISIHMLAVGGLTGVMIGISFRLMINLNFIIFLLILLSGIIGFSRLKLNAHKPMEVYSGYLVSLLFFIVLFVLK